MKTAARAPQPSGEKVRPAADEAAAPEKPAKARAAKAERTEKPARSERRQDDLHLSAPRRLYGARSENTHVRGGGDADALWSSDRPRRNGRAGRTQDPEKLQQELDKTKDQIDRAADRLERMWRKGDRRFREKVLEELERGGKLTPELRAQIADELTRARRLERAIERTRNPERRAALEAEYKKVTGEIERIFTENGVELEFLKAVERAAGEASFAGSLTNLVEAFLAIVHDLFVVRSTLNIIGGDLFKPQRDRVDRAKAAEDDALSGRLARELEQLAAVHPQAV